MRIVNGSTTAGYLTVPVEALGGREVTTIEGITGREAEAVQVAWVDRDVPQCGFSQSGSDTSHSDVRSRFWPMGRTRVF